MSDQRFKSFTVADPHYFDGDPFEVAERAVRQAEAVAGVLKETLESATVMARNAELERQLFVDGECDAAGFDDSPQGRRLNALVKSTDGAIKMLGVLARAAGYNPKNPSKV